MLVSFPVEEFVVELVVVFVVELVVKFVVELVVVLVVLLYEDMTISPLLRR